MDGLQPRPSAERRAPSADYCLGSTTPPSPPDRPPPRRGGGFSPYRYAATAAGRSTGPAPAPVARRGLVRSARALAAAALLALSGALALPSTAEAQTDNTAPTLSSAAVLLSGTSILVVFSENLNVPTTLPSAARNAFTVKVGGDDKAIDFISWTLSSDILDVDFSDPIYQGQTVVVSYDKTAAGDDAHRGRRRQRGRLLHHREHDDHGEPLCAGQPERPGLGVGPGPAGAPAT